MRHACAVECLRDLTSERVPIAKQDQDLLRIHTCSDQFDARRSDRLSLRPMSGETPKIEAPFDGGRCSCIERRKVLRDTPRKRVAGNDTNRRCENTRSASKAAPEYVICCPRVTCDEALDA